MKTQILQCELGNHEWEREIKKGKSPKSCPDCKEVPTVRLCNCNCGGELPKKKRYLEGHAPSYVAQDETYLVLCECGCNRAVREGMTVRENATLSPVGFYSLLPTKGSSFPFTLKDLNSFLPKRVVKGLTFQEYVKFHFEALLENESVNRELLSSDQKAKIWRGKLFELCFYNGLLHVGVPHNEILYNQRNMLQQNIDVDFLVGGSLLFLLKTSFRERLQQSELSANILKGHDPSYKIYAITYKEFASDDTDATIKHTRKMNNSGNYSHLDNILSIVDPSLDWLIKEELEEFIGLEN